MKIDVACVFSLMQIFASVCIRILMETNKELFNGMNF